MKMKKDSVTINILYSIFANSISLLSNALLLFLLPKFLTEDGYGYYNLYLFYISYVGIFHFGLADGAYLRYGGSYYENLDKKIIKGQLVFLIAFEIIITFTIIIFGITKYNDGERMYIIVIAALNCIIYLPRTFLQYVLQASGKIALYAKNYIFERVSFLLLVVVFFIFNKYNYKYLLLADIFVKFFTGVLFIFSCKDIFTSPIPRVQIILKEILTNCKVGCILLFANLSGILIIGFIRLVIEKKWNIAVFGKISLALTICNVFVSFINAISLVLFPYFKRLQQNDLINNYKKLSIIVTLGMFCCMPFFFPVKIFVDRFLPLYNESVAALSVLFPIALFETRMALLLLTYMKIYRREKSILYINLITVVLSLIYSLFSYFFSYTMIINLIAIVVLMGVRAFLFDIYVKKTLLKIKNFDIYYNIGYAVIFILLSNQNCIISISFFIVYCLIYYLLNFRKVQKLLI